MKVLRNLAFLLAFGAIAAAALHDHSLGAAQHHKAANHCCLCHTTSIAATEASQTLRFSPAFSFLKINYRSIVCEKIALVSSSPRSPPLT